MKSKIDKGHDNLPLWLNPSFCDWIKNNKANEFIECGNSTWVDNIPEKKYWGLDPNQEGKFLYRWLTLLIASVYEPDIVTLETEDQKICEIISKHGPSKKWLKAQEKYLNGLSCMNRVKIGPTSYSSTYIPGCDSTSYEIIMAYSESGDRVLNNYLRRGRKMNDIRQYMQQTQVFSKIMPETDLETRLNYIVDSLSNTIRSAPVLDKDIIVYRGVSRMTYKNGETIIVDGFLSTSIHVGVALNFASGESPTLLMIKVPAGTPCLVNAFASWQAQEAEILLLPGTKILVNLCENNIKVPTIDDDFETDDDIDTYGFNCSFDKSLQICFCEILNS